MKAPKEILILTSTWFYMMYPAYIRYAQKNGWHLSLCERSAPPKDWHGDGVITMMLNTPTMVSFVKYLKTKRIPCVDILNAVPSLKLPCVVSDYAAAAQFAAKHFRDCGFRHTAFFAMEHTNMHDELYRHFVRATKGETPRRWIWPDKAVNPNNYVAHTKWVRSLLRKTPLPIAVWCFNDYNAASFADICSKAGFKIPEDVAILGHGDITMHTQTAVVPLSSVAVNWERRARTACSLLERLIKGGTPPENPITIKPLGVTIRKSTDGIAIANQTLRKAICTATDIGRCAYSVDQIARAMGTPRSTLNALSKGELGKSLHDAINAERMRKAERMLADTDLKLSAIASDLGFCHASYFIRSFRAAKGMTPTEWRKSAQSSSFHRDKGKSPWLEG